MMYRCYIAAKTLSILLFLFFHAYGIGDYRFEVLGNTGYIASPNHPNKYPKNTSCLWNITVESGYAVNLTIKAFDLEKTVGCTADFLQIRISPDKRWADLTRYCYDAPGSVFSESGWAQVWFVSDAGNMFSGFNITWQAIKQITSTFYSSMLSPTLVASDPCILNSLHAKTPHSTVTITSCIKAPNISVPQGSVTSSLLFNNVSSTTCNCDTILSGNSSFASSIKQSLTKLETPLLKSFVVTSSESFADKLTGSSARSMQQRVWTTEILRSSSLAASEILDYGSKSEFLSVTSTIQSLKIDVSSTDALVTSHVAMECRSKGTGNNLSSSLINILLSVGGIFLLIGIVFCILLCKETKFNRVDTMFDG